MAISILFRPTSDTIEEEKIAKNYFSVRNYRVGCKNSLIIGRYSVLPYYKELAVDLKFQNSELINNYKQHSYIANFKWYYDLIDYTPKTWFDDNFYKAPEGKYVVKGKTNSRKWEWDRLMFAKTKRQASNIGAELSSDNLIGCQGIVYREYVPLVTYEIGLNGLPFSNEWRFFFYKENCLSHGYYWSTALDTDYVIDLSGYEFAIEMAKIVAKKTNFFVLDIAEKTNGGWTVIEVNDGQMSGLSENCPDTLYKNLLYYTHGLQ